MTAKKSSRKSIKSTVGQSLTDRSVRTGEFIVPSVSKTSAFYYYANNAEAREEAAARVRKAVRLAERRMRAHGHG